MERRIVDTSTNTVYVVSAPNIESPTLYKPIEINSLPIDNTFKAFLMAIHIFGTARKELLYEYLAEPKEKIDLYLERSYKMGFIKDGDSKQTLCLMNKEYPLK